MKFKFLGTAAFEAIPSLFCVCENCKKIRKIGGKSLRTRTQAIIDDRLLIDFPPDTVSHILSNNIDLSKVKNCLITHSHPDHLYVEDMMILKEGFATTDEDYSITYYSTEIAGKKIGAMLAAVPKMSLQNVREFDRLTVDKYTVTVLPAIHGKDTGPVIYQIEDGKNTVLYGLDTHFLHNDIFEYWKKTKPYFSLVVLDCTGALTPVDYVGHMSLLDNIDVKNRMIKIGVADEKTIFVSNHFSHNGSGVIYEEFSRIAAKEGILTSYDGMEILL